MPEGGALAPFERCGAGEVTRRNYSRVRGAIEDECRRSCKTGSRALLEAALEVFAAHGFLAATMALIAERAAGHSEHVRYYASKRRSSTP